MASPTQRNLAMGDIAAFAREAFGFGVRHAAPLSGGTFAAVWRVHLDDGREVVLMVGPHPDVPLLTYERDMIGCEADYFRLVGRRLPQVPVPKVLYHGGHWLFTTLLPGKSLAEQDPHSPDLDSVREQLGAAVARLHTITGPRFGYIGDRPHATTWGAAFSAMVEAILTDARVWKVSLPVAVQQIRDVVAVGMPTLAEVTVPTLVHFDLWDGNVLCANGKLTGLVDGERYLYGDPLVDFVAPALFRPIEDEPEHPFLRGYSSVTGTPVVWDPKARQRLALYRLYMYLLMHIEVPSRGITDRKLIDFLAEHLANQVAALETGL